MFVAFQEQFAETLRRIKRQPPPLLWRVNDMGSEDAVYLMHQPIAVHTGQTPHGVHVKPFVMRLGWTYLYKEVPGGTERPR